MDQNQIKTSGIVSQEDKLDLPKRVINLEGRAEDIKTGFEKLEKEMGEFKHLSYFLTGTIGLALGITTILVGLDYFKYNEERSREIMEETVKIKSGFYSKEDADEYFINKVEFYTKEQLQAQIEQNNINSRVLNCLKIKGYFSVQCFE